MEKIKKLFVLLLFALISCDNGSEVIDNLDYCVFGTFSGFCIGNNCVQMYKLQGQSLYKDPTAHYPGDAAYDGIFVRLSDEKYRLAEYLRSEIPSELFHEEGRTIGSPDAYDQGGIFIEIRRGRVVRHWSIDADSKNIPGYLRGFTAEVKSVVGKLR